MCSIDTRHYLPRKGKNVTSTPVTVYQTGLCLECRGFRFFQGQGFQKQAQKLKSQKGKVRHTTRRL